MRFLGMGGEYDGPFYSHTTGYTTGEMVEALDDLEAVIEEMGPFDGVVGFSQGAATAISYIYDQQTRHGRRPFGFALLFSSVCAFSPNPDYSRGIIDGLAARSFDLAQSGAADVSSLTPDERLLWETILKVIKPLRDGHALLPDIDLDVYTRKEHVDNAPRLLLPQLMGEKIKIPTFHMHGKRDTQFMRDMSLIARGMFDESLMRKAEHSGSHHPPNKDSEVRTAVGALEWVIGQSRKLGLLPL
jgi:pimeloyl-ACP methyl ester carboxylesterase